MVKIEICIPAYNEAEHIVDSLQSLLDICNKYPVYSWSIVVVDNASTDETVARVRSLTDTRVRLISETIQGKGAALSAGARSSSADILVYIDADLSADPHHIIDLAVRVQDGSDLVVGSRLVDTTNVHRSFWRTCTSYLFKAYADVLVPVPVRDSQCGIKAMNHKGIAILSSCIERGWFIDRELLGKAAKQKLVIVEQSVMWEEFRYPDRKSKLHVLRASMQSIRSLWNIRKEIRKYT
jgi:glycosyltransferase involved in cell wall biosynthesis